MTKKIKYLLCHGFGFSDDFWKDLTPLLDAEHEFFDKEKSAKYRIETNYVGIGHSIGFQKLNNSGIKFKALIGLQGFLNFCGNEPDQRNFLRQTLARMVSTFSKNKTKSLYFFHQLCGIKRPLPPELPAESLLENLHAMETSYAHCGCPTLIISTDDDPVVGKNIILDNFGQLPRTTIDFIAGKHHLLGLLQADEVAKRIENFLKAIEKFP